MASSREIIRRLDADGAKTAWYVGTSEARPILASCDYFHRTLHHHRHADSQQKKPTIGFPPRRHFLPLMLAPPIRITTCLINAALIGYVVLVVAFIACSI